MKCVLSGVVLATCLVVVTSGRETFIMDERWVCNIKNTCLDCLRFPHCSWCKTENKCFSKSLPSQEDYCKDNSIEHEDLGFGFEENAKCACLGDKIEQNCYPPGVTEGDVCHGRGNCVCGRCVCNATPEPAHPTKTIMGEHCEFDNFSCDGPKCNEGPYSINEPFNQDEDLLEDI